MGEMCRTRVRTCPTQGRILCPSCCRGRVITTFPENPNDREGQLNFPISQDRSNEPSERNMRSRVNIPGPAGLKNVKMRLELAWC